jgi:predicted nucleic acid-binding protein
VRTLYLDASALVKLVVREIETVALEAFVADAVHVFTSALAAIEVPRAAARAGPAPGAVEIAEQLLARCRRVELDAEIESVAARVLPVGLKTVDAIHLASALRVRDLLDAVVIYDQRLAHAASAAGLAVVTPGLDS